MKKTTTILSIIFCNFLVAQKPFEIINNKNRVKAKENIFLVYDDNQKIIKYDISENDKAVNTKKSVDSAFFLIDNNPTVYLQVLNPLKYNTSFEQKEVLDQIDADAAKALESIFSTFNVVENSLVDVTENNKAFFQKMGTGIFERKMADAKKSDSVFMDWKNKVSEINELLKSDKKNEINEIFNELRNIEIVNFIKAPLTTINEKKKQILTHFDNISTLISQLDENIKKTESEDETIFIRKQIFNSILKDLKGILNEQKKRYDNLDKAYKLVIESGKNLIEIKSKFWKELLEVNLPEGKIKNLTIKVNSGGYEILNEEIVATETKEITQSTIRFREFDHFIPEASVGVAYTFFKYNTYGTITDSTGQQFIATPTENLVRNINIAAMLNYNLYSPNWKLHPLWQIGAGINSGIPTLLTGIGLRGEKFRIAGGMAMTWINELDKLKVGDRISGTDDINKDLKPQFSWPHKGYVSIQFNF